MRHRNVWLNVIVAGGLLLGGLGCSVGDGSGDGGRSSDGTPPTTVNRLIEEQETVSSAADTTYTLSLTVVPTEGGTTTPPAGDHAYDEDETVSVSATPNSGWSFLGWTGPDAGECDQGSVTMTGDKACTANFGGFWLGASPSPPEGGIVVKAPGESEYPHGYPAGTVVSVSADPSDGWQLDGWSGPDAALCETGSVEMNDDVFCAATFSHLPPPAPLNEHWMADVAHIIGDRRLKDVVLPGSHDAGTYALSPDSAWVSFVGVPAIWQWIQDLDYAILQLPRRIAVAWAKTQSSGQNIYMQLKGGLRYFDLRFVKAHDGFAYIYHGSIRVTSEDRDDVLDYVQQFLNEPGHEQEIIILDLSKWANMGDVSHHAFVQAVLNRFENTMIPEADWDKTLNEIWQSGRQLVVHYEDLNVAWLVDPSDYDLFWTDEGDDKVLCRPWASTYDRDKLEGRSILFMGGEGDPVCCGSDCSEDSCQCGSFCSDSGSPCDRLFTLQALLTPDEQLIKCGVARQIRDAVNGLGLCGIPFVGDVCDWLLDEALSFCPSDSVPISPEPRSLWELVTQPTHISTDFAEWCSYAWSNCLYNFRDNLNIIMIDFYDSSTIMDEVIAINRGDYNEEPQMGIFSVPPGHPPLVEGAPVHISADFNDADTCDFHTATILWGDGTEEDVEVNQDFNTVEASHIYADNRTYSAMLCVRDGPEPQEDYSYHYSEACGFLDIVVDNVAPIVDAGLDQIIYEGDVVTLDPATFRDPGFDCPSCVPPSVENFSATIDWSDGTTEPTTDITVTETPGSEGVETTGAVASAAGHQYLGPPGNYTVTVCVTDDDGGQGCDTLNVKVVHGFLRFCAYGDCVPFDDDGDEGAAVTIYREVLAECPQTPSGVPGEMRRSGVGGRGQVSVKDQAIVNGVLQSHSSRIHAGTDATVLFTMTAGHDVRVAERSHIHDSITSGRRADVKRDAWVGGDITAADRVTVDPSATVTGAITEYAIVPPIPDSTWVELSVSPGTEDVTVPRPGGLTLAPGEYRDLRVRRGATLTLLSGQYVFRTVKAEQDAQLEFDLSGGPIVVDVAGKLELKQDVNMAISQPPAAGPEDILFRVAHQERDDDGAEVQLHSGGAYLGTFLAPYGMVHLGDDTTLSGALYGQKVKVGQRAQVTGMPARDLFASLFVDP